jgi:hypothetical protein
MRAMQRDANARYAGVSELGAALLAFAPPALAQQWSAEFSPPSSAAVVEPAVEATGRTWVDADTPVPPARRSGLIAAAISGAIAASALIGWRVWEAQSSPERPPLSAASASGPLAPQPASAEPSAAVLGEPPAAASDHSGPAQVALPSKAELVSPAPAAAATKRARATHPSQPSAAADLARPDAGVHPHNPSVTLGDNGAPILE